MRFSSEAQPARPLTAAITTITFQRMLRPPPVSTFRHSVHAVSQPGHLRGGGPGKNREIGIVRARRKAAQASEKSSRGSWAKFKDLSGVKFWRSGRLFLAASCA